MFPFVGAWVRPEKGSAVVWWNMDRAGGYDALLKHGGCPVIIGSKWITNKWVRAHAQMFRRPCPRYRIQQIDLGQKNLMLLPLDNMKRGDSNRTIKK